MQTRSHSKTDGLTWIDVMILLGMVWFLVVLILPAILATRPRNSGIQCLSNQKQISLAVYLWMQDHELTNPPWQVSTNKGGSWEHIGKGTTFRHFQLLSNQLPHPAVLACPHDAPVLKAASWQGKGKRVFRRANFCPTWDKVRTGWFGRERAFSG